MKKIKSKNSYIDQVENQINNTLDAMYRSGLLYTYNYIHKESRDNNIEVLTWQNHKSGKFNTGSCFLRLEQYMQILNNSSYLCILYDGSIIRVSYKFTGDILIGQNLLWWPAPYNYEKITLEDIPPQDLIEEFIEDSSWQESLKMRSPVRFDFDPSNDAVSETHSPTHLHMQHEDCRIYVEKPLCFNRFIKFILKNYYPNLAFKIGEHDYIDFKTADEKWSLEFENSRIIL